MPDLTDDDLFHAHAEGDAVAFQVLFGRHQAAVHNFAWTLLRNRHDAEEVLIETFVAVARAAGEGSYAARGRFKAWIMRVARNRCLNRIAAARACPVIGDGEELAELAPAAPDLAPPEQVAQAERQARLREAVGRLPLRQREALALYAFEQMRYEEIAAVMGTPLNTVKTLIRRARAALAADWSGEEDGR
jgi:RNA polymerase sigma-70 factor (ECF subfamily)